MRHGYPVRKSFESVAKTAQEAMERETEAGEQATKRAGQSYSVATEGLREFNAKLMDMAKANTTAGLTFFAELAGAQRPTEAFELWSRHAQNNFQRLTAQSQELVLISQRIASSSTQPFRRAFDQTW